MESSLRKPSLMTPDPTGHVPTLCEPCSQRPAPQETLPGPHLCESTALDSWFKGQSILPKTQEPVWFDSRLCTYPLDTAHSRCSINVYLQDGACPFLPRVLHPTRQCLPTSDITNNCFMLTNISSIWMHRVFPSTCSRFTFLTIL